MQAELLSMELCESKAKSMATTTKDILECVKFYLLSPISEEGLLLGLKFVHGNLLQFLQVIFLQLNVIIQIKVCSC